MQHHQSPTQRRYCALRRHLLRYACQRYRQQHSSKKRVTDRKVLRHLAHRIGSQLKRVIRKLRGLHISLYRSNATQLLQAIIYSFWRALAYTPSHTFAALLLTAGILLSTNILYVSIFKDLPTAESLTQFQPPLTTTITDRNGVVLYRVHGDENRTLLPLSEISLNLVHATIAIEDKDFYFHHGFSIRGITRAAYANMQGATFQGGSTLTQQLVKHRLLTSERTITRKIRELILAVLVEDTYEKKQILELYLNQVPYGGSAYGVEAAAQRYFGKSARNLDLAESALIAGLTAAPSIYSPFGSNPELAIVRQQEVLRRMLEDGYISLEQAEQAATQQLQFTDNTTNIAAPHFVMFVREQLADEYGEEYMATAGLTIQTTLDSQLQSEIEKIVAEEVIALKKMRVSNGAALITNPKTGEILSMVGSVNYFDFKNDGQVNLTIRSRQPGSSIKPLTYATAFEHGFSPASIIDDSPITYSINGSPPYSPKNYDGKYHGKVTLRESLASSYNIPAVKLLNSIGVPSLIQKAESLGITTWKDRERFGLSLTLGGGEVRMVDMAEAYGTFANGGERVPLQSVISITDGTGRKLYQNPCVSTKNLPTTSPCQGIPVLDAGIAYQISNILSDNSARTPAFGAQSALSIPEQEVAVKTGTTNNLRDNWTFGYTTDRVVSVWVGNNDNTPMSAVASGVTGASPIWNKLMRLQLSAENPHQFTVPKTIATMSVCRSANGQLCGDCKSGQFEYFVSGQSLPTCRFISTPVTTTPTYTRTTTN